MPIVLTTGNTAAWQILGICIEFFFIFTFFAIAGAYIFLNTSYYQKRVSQMGGKINYFEGKEESTPQIRKGRAILSTLLFIFMCFYFVPQLFEFHTVKIEADSTWKLKNVFGIPIATIPPSEKRDLWLDDKQLTFYNTYRKVDVSFVGIVTADKTYMSMGNEYKPIKAFYTQLKQNAEKNKTIQNFEPHYNFQFIAYARYILIGLMLLVGWWFWRKPKGKTLS